MPFGAHVFSMLETALTECFQYHNGLDTFLQRSGVRKARLAASRQRAEDRNKVSGRFPRAPKRFVVQEVLHDINNETTDDDQLVAALITGLCRGNFPEAGQSGQEAIESLKNTQALEQKEAADRQAEQERQQQATEQQRRKIREFAAAKRQEFHQSFLKLCSEPDHQKRGFALEKFLNDLFEFEGLSPRSSFKVIGEQIDGSFAWSVHTHLVEAKWVQKPTAGIEFGAFVYNIGGKTADTRGLYISINGYSQQAITGLNCKGELRFICIDGAHLLRCLEPNGDLKRMLQLLWRHASETGEAYLPVSSDVFLNRAG